MTILWGSTAAHAQYQVESWTTDNGLPQNTIQSILQTRDGYLWLTTQDGLVRYDGVRFTVFNKNNTKGINSNRFTELKVDRDDNLWIGTESNGVVRYHDGAFETYTIAGDPQREPKWNLTVDDQGNLVASTELGIIRWNGERFVAHQTLAGETKESLLFWGKEGSFWYANGRLLHRFKDGKSSDYSLPGFVKGLYEDRKGRLWVGTTAAGLLVLENDHLTVFTIKDGLPSNHTLPCIEDENGNLWAITDRGAVTFRDGKMSRLTTEQGLSDNALGAIFLDREGNVWIGTYYRGLNRLSRQSVAFFTTADGLAAEIVHPIYEDREGNVWIGGKGLTRWHDGRFGQAPDMAKGPLGVTAIHQDQQGRIWFGTWNGAYYYENGKFTNFSGKFGSPQSLADIHEDRTGTFWFATTAGLFRYRDGAMAQLTTKEGLAGNEVKIISESPDGTLWIGTYGGLTRFKDGVFASFTTSNGLASNLVRSLYEDKEGVLWIGSYDGGLTRLKNGKFARYTSNDGLFNDGVFQILEDDDGNLWMSCNRGIYRVAKQQLHDFADGKIARINSTAYGKADGLLETECNGGQQPAGYRRLLPRPARGTESCQCEVRLADGAREPTSSRGTDHQARRRDPEGDGVRSRARSAGDPERRSGTVGPRQRVTEVQRRLRSPDPVEARHRHLRSTGQRALAAGARLSGGDELSRLSRNPHYDRAGRRDRSADLPRLPRPAGAGRQ
jgi:ligand-binding sensor domain-containing protein